MIILNTEAPDDVSEPWQHDSSACNTWPCFHPFLSELWRVKDASVCFVSPDRWLKKVRIRVLSTSNYIPLVENRTYDTQYDWLEKERSESSSDCIFETKTDENIWKWLNFFVFRYFCMRHSQTFTVNTFISYWPVLFVLWKSSRPTSFVPPLQANESCPWPFPAIFLRDGSNRSSKEMWDMSYIILILIQLYTHLHAKGNTLHWQIALREKNWSIPSNLPGAA